MNIGEILEVVAAYTSGSTIQVKLNTIVDEEHWKDFNINRQNEDGVPDWDFSSHIYRVKPEIKYRPYISLDEFYSDFRLHGPFMKRKDGQSVMSLPLNVYANYGGVFYASFLFNNEKTDYSFPYLEKNYVWADGCHVGVMES